MGILRENGTNLWKYGNNFVWKNGIANGILGLNTSVGIWEFWKSGKLSKWENREKNGKISGN